MARFRPASKLGRRGERVAARFLRRRGYRVIARNMHVGFGEADLVCESRRDGALVIVEVKTRSASPGGLGARTPEAQVGRAKQAKLRRVAQAVRATLRAEGRPIRIDMVAVEFPSRGWVGRLRPAVRHIEGAVGW